MLQYLPELSSTNPMRVRYSTLMLLVAVELLLVIAAIAVVREARFAWMRASCVNGLKEQSAPAIVERPHR